MKIQCDSCSREIPSYDVNLVTLVGRCTVCNSVFNVTPQLGRETPRKAPVGALLPLPSSMTRHETGAAERDALSPYRASSAAATPEVELVRRWFTWSDVGLIPFTLMAMFAATSLTLQTFLIPEAFSFGRLLGLLPFFAAAVTGAYMCLTQFLNKTIISVSSDRVRVKHVPIQGWSPPLEIPASEIKQVFCHRRLLNPFKKRSATYTVMAQLKTGETRALLKNLPDSDEALYIEQEIEMRLGIEDTPIIGETSTRGPRSLPSK